MNIMIKNIGQYTFGLFKVKPSFIDGYSSLVDFGSPSNRYNVSATVEEADTQALYSDWRAVGEDIRDSINKSHEYVGAQ